MLRKFAIPSTSSMPLGVRCGEVFCQNLNNITIICTFCKIKTFNLDEFLEHYKNLHTPSNYQPESKSSDGTSVKGVFEIKNEDVEIADYSSEEFCVRDEQDPLSVSKCAGQPHKKIQKKLFDDAEFFNIHDESNDIQEYIESDVINNTSTSECDEDNAMASVEEAEDEDTQIGILTNFQGAHKRIYTCPNCEKPYASDKSLNHHIKLKHLRAKKFKCADCSEKFAADRSLQAHRRKVHIGYSCNDCDKVFDKARPLRYHKYRMHSKIKNFVCDFENCDEAFACRRLLVCHQSVHGIGEIFICETCGHRTRTKSNLTVHVRSHTGERPYVCNECGKGFASKSLLNDHAPIHSNERPHKCDVCGAAFSRPKALYHHKHLHLAIKKFVCKICNKAYAQAAGLSAHMRGHRLEMQKTTEK